MSAEEMVTATPVEASPTSGSSAESHKRKIDELELNNPRDPHIGSEPNFNSESVNKASNGDTNGASEEFEAKRPRLESNGGSVSRNGRSEQKEEAPEEEEPEEEDPEEEDPEEEELKEEGEPQEEEEEQPKSAESTGISVEGKEPSETHNEESSSQPSETIAEDPVTEPAEMVTEPLETITEEHVSEPLEKITEKAAENENPEIKSAANLGKTEGEVEEPSLELPKEGDVPVAPADTQYGSDTQTMSRKMEVPNDKVGVIIGKLGDTIRSLQDNSGAKIQITRDADADPLSTTRPLEIVGTIESINIAEKLIKGVIAEADAGGSPSLVARGFNTVQAASGGEQVEIQVPIEKVGLIIGKGGETIRNLQTRSGARIQLLQLNTANGDQSKERIVRMTGNKKQIETAGEMIKDVMNQTPKPSPLSGGHNQQGFRPRGHVSPQWGHRGPHNAQYSSYDFPHRGPHPSLGSQYPNPYGNYPPQLGPRSNYGPSWEQRPPLSMRGPPSQGNYNYGQQQAPDYGHPPAYSQAPTKPYGQGYNEVKYDQNYGSQPTPYGQGAQNQYSKPPTYGMQPQAPHAQPYGQTRPTQPGEVPYQGSISSTPSYGQSVPPQQSYPYASTGQMQQAYPPPYGSTPSHLPAAAPSSGYPSQGGQPVAGYNTQPVPQQAAAYPQAAAGPAGGYGSYPPAQPVANNAAYGYQGQADSAYGVAQAPAGTGYAQPAQAQPSYDQSAYPQYDSTGQMYGAAR